MRRRGTRALPVVSLVVALGCGGEPGSVEVAGRRGEGTAEVGGDVVATVDGHPITAGDVVRAVRVTGLSKERALERLVRQELLVLEARRRGYADAPSVRRIAEKAAVQALLARAVEEPVPPRPDLDDEALVSARRERLDALLNELAQRIPVERRDDAIARALAADEATWEPGAP